VEVGRQYLDNSEDNRMAPALRLAPGYQRKLVEEHAILNGLLSLDLEKTFGVRFWDSRRTTLELRGTNLTDLSYETSGYVYFETPYFYPAASRSWFVSVKAEF
jgi:hypothetical protein